jgi:hypothetical protein
MDRDLSVPRSHALPTGEGVRQWVRDHDERWSFVIIYLGLAVGLSVFVSLFWLLAVAGLHLALELGRQSQHREGKLEVLSHALWEVKLDVGLILLALSLVLYIDVVLGLLGLQSAARAAAVTRAGARVGARAAAWERNIRTFLLTVDEMARIGYAAYLVRRGRAGVASETQPPEPVPQVATSPGDGWRGRWGIGDRIGLLLVVGGVIMLVVAPLLTPHDWGTAGAAIMEELRPFPSS